jgi:RES domain-containing protein
MRDALLHVHARDTDARDVLLWRIAADTAHFTADDVSGAGARETGGRWNRAGVALLYTSSSRALACLETVVHLREQGLPLNRYLVEIRVPEVVWKSRTVCEGAAHVGWDAIPEGRVSLEWGARWIARGESALAEVPSVVVPEETNVLINPQHADVRLLTVRKVRRWTYDARSFGRQ